MSAARENPHPQQTPSTYFAPAERLTPTDLERLIQEITNSPIVDTILGLVGGWVCVVSHTRQIVAVNHALLEALGADQPMSLLGLRPGEVLECVHAHEHAGGCGTSRVCATCGAAIAMVAAQQTGQPQERECVLTYARGGVRRDQDFLVRCSPFPFLGENLLLVCLRDQSDEQRRIALERTFLHDISNLLMVLLPTAELLKDQQTPPRPEMLNSIHRAAILLTREVRIQRLLAQDHPEKARVDLEPCYPSQVLDELADLLRRHPAGRGQTLTRQPLGTDADIPFPTDQTLLLRVLTNMVVNAFEAGQAGDEVRLGATADVDTIEFHVWNRGAIPDATVPRVFQRYFSTKPGGGRGLGTYTMKLLGEALLRGKVSFTTSPQAGTTFRLRLPRQTA
jgi:hypothetical protein